MPRQARTKPRRIRLSKLYSFACGRSAFDAPHPSELGGPGFSRVVRANQPDSHDPAASNSISTTKYNAFTFLPKSLFEQFRRVANIYFLITACLAYTDLAPYGSGTAVYPLVLVVSATMIKELIEDLRRKQQVITLILFLLPCMPIQINQIKSLHLIIQTFINSAYLL